MQILCIILSICSLLVLVTIISMFIITINKRAVETELLKEISYNNFNETVEDTISKYEETTKKYDSEIMNSSMKAESVLEIDYKCREFLTNLKLTDSGAKNGSILDSEALKSEIRKFDEILTNLNPTILNFIEIEYNLAEFSHVYKNSTFKNINS